MMTRKIFGWMGGALLVASLPAVLEAQLALEVRGGAAVGNHAPAAAGMETLPGPSFSGTVLLRVAPAVSLYGTFASSEFGCEGGFCTDRNVRVTSGGFGGGLRVHLTDVIWAQGGVLTLGTDVAADGADEAGDPELTGEAGAGLSIPVFGRVRLVPGAMYRMSVDAGRRTTVVVGELGVQVGLGDLW